MKSLKYVIGYLTSMTIIMVSGWLDWFSLPNVEGDIQYLTGWTVNLDFFDFKIPCTTLIVFGLTLGVLALLELLNIFNVKDWLMLSLFTFLLFFSFHSIYLNAVMLETIVIQEGVMSFLIGILLLIVIWSIRRIDLGQIKSWKGFFITEV